MTLKAICCATEHLHNTRRGLLKSAMGASAAALSIGLLVPQGAHAASLTKADRDALTPEQIIASMKEGNQRFRAGKTTQHDYVAQKISSAAGQFPAAVILSCIDSRAPAEIIFDTGIGDAFNARIAGNVANEDLVGSMEFACAAAGAKLVLVMGHTACGAVQGAINGVQLGNLTGLLNRIKPSIDATLYNGDRSGKNAQFVDAVAKSNVLHTIDMIRKSSKILADLETAGKIKIAGAMYHLDGGMVDFF